MPEENKNKKLVKKTPSPEEFRMRMAESKKAGKEEKSIPAEAPVKYKMGEMVPGQGVFFGQYSPKDKEGKSLGKIFNAFAAPQDLADRTTGYHGVFRYAEAMMRIAGLKGWHGFDGGRYTNDEDLHTALKNGTYKGEWIIPPRELLSGKNADGKDTQPDNLFAHKDKGSLKGTFTTRGSVDSLDTPDRYWSCTERRDDTECVWNIEFPSGLERATRNTYGEMSCRPVRLVEVRP